MSDVCIVGAGSSGISSCQVLKARGIEFDCFEKGSNVGGLWRYENDSGLSSAYRSLYINTSRKVMEYRAYPIRPTTRTTRTTRSSPTTSTTTWTASASASTSASAPA